MADVGTCALAGCQVADGGSCIEGFERLAECPNYVPTPPADAEPAPNGTLARQTVPTSAVAAEATEAPLGLSSGNALFAGHFFAGSHTLIGFERIYHLARAVSQRSTEDTERTKRGTENNLLHFDLVAQDDGRRHRLLISELSGELFEAATTATDHVYAIPYLRRADHVVLFADAEKLSDDSQRQYLLNQLLVLLRSCIENNRLSATSIVTVVVSRYDLLASDLDRSFLGFMEARLRHRADSYFRQPIRFLNLAARPATGDVYGLADLLRIWIQEIQVISASEVSHRREVPAREIDKFAYKDGKR